MTIGFDDDFDPLAPPDFGDAPDEAADPGVGGFADPDRIVRVWVEDNRLTKVRVSPVWFRRVMGEDTLENHFRQAFAEASFSLASVPDESTAPVDEDEDGLADDDAAFDQLPRLSKASLAAFGELFAQVERRIDEAVDSSAPGRAEPAPPTVGTAQGVTVVLDARGRACDVQFEEDWLDEAQVGAIGSAVLAAAQDAYARHGDTGDAHPELDDLLEERRLLMAAYRAMLNPRRSRR